MQNLQVVIHLPIWFTCDSNLLSRLSLVIRLTLKSWTTDLPSAPKPVLASCSPDRATSLPSPTTPSVLPIMESWPSDWPELALFAKCKWCSQGLFWLRFKDPLMQNSQSFFGIWKAASSHTLAVKFTHSLGFTRSHSTPPFSHAGVHFKIQILWLRICLCSITNHETEKKRSWSTSYVCRETFRQGPWDVCRNRNDFESRGEN